MSDLRSACLALVVAGLLAPVCAAAGEGGRYRRGDRVAIGQSLVVPAGTTQDGDVVCIFGDASVHGRVTGQLVVVGGSLSLSGSVEQDVVSVLSRTELDSGARIGGQLVAIGSLDDRGAEIEEGYTEIPLVIPFGSVAKPFAVLASLVLWIRLIALILFFVVVLLLAAIFPERVRAISDEVPTRYAVGLFVGIGAYVGAALLDGLLVLTVVGLSLIPFLALALVSLHWLGRAAVLELLGRKLGRAVGREMSLLGSILLGFVPYALVLLLPLMIGGIVGILSHVATSVLLWLVIDVPGIGLVLLTRAGGRRPLPAPSFATAPPAPPPAAAPLTGAPDPDSREARRE
jgi:hypothetical protein